MKSVRSVLLIAVLSSCSLARAQALPAATREPIEAGAAFSFGSPDYQNTPTYVEGFTIFTDAGLSKRLAAELDLHYDSLITPLDIGENTYLIGPRYSVIREDRANIYVKALGGLGRFAYQSGIYSNPHADTYGVVAFGAGIEFRASQHLNIRAIDLEYQVWPGFPSSALEPVVASTGLAYRF